VRVLRKNGLDLAGATDVRLPTGDELNYHGAGAYGVKPFVVLSTTTPLFSAHLNAGYQWNGSSFLASPAADRKQQLPSQLLHRWTRDGAHAENHARGGFHESVDPRWPAQLPENLSAVIVIDMRGRRVKGVLTAVDKDSVSLATDGRTQTFARSDVSTVRVADGFGNGALIGAGAGLGTALGILAIAGSGDRYAVNTKAPECDQKQTVEPPSDGGDGSPSFTCRYASTPLDRIVDRMSWKLSHLRQRPTAGYFPPAWLRS
jgi:hypothetical protein